MLLPLVKSCIPEDILRIWLRNPPVSTVEESYSKKLTQLLKFLRLEEEEDSEDLIAITPAMFLMSNSSAEVTDLDLNDFTKFHRRVRFRAKLFKDLKSRFRKEYLGLLAQKW
ncbi:hypothetical protein TNCT_245521 [Trichonephila clavata]|uniref:Uncharacterized protein n=1 Tax=Trichonephila clavata TaxID=2740835 RepID=A0A8X6K3S1_TRICU|nr:hypothetical protein TNCT_245521 [Trichonephila clavata]